MITLFAGRPIACEMGVLKAFVVDLLVYCIELKFYFLAGPLQCNDCLWKFLHMLYLRIRILFAGRLIAYEMSVTICNELSITY